MSGVKGAQQSPKLHDGSSNLPASAIAEWCNGIISDSDSEDTGSTPVSAAICTVGSGCRPVCKTGLCEFDSHTVLFIPM